MANYRCQQKAHLADTKETSGDWRGDKNRGPDRGQITLGITGTKCKFYFNGHEKSPESLSGIVIRSDYVSQRGSSVC